MFVSVRAITFKALLRNFIHRFICQLNDSKNEIIVSLINVRVSTTRYQSKLWRHWYRCILWVYVTKLYGCCNGLYGFFVLFVCLFVCFSLSFF